MMTAVASTEINYNLPCIRCRYNLRGLPRGGRCPECGEQIAETLRAILARQQVGAPLDRADPRWVAGLFEGTLWLLVTPAIAFFLGFAPSQWHSSKSIGLKVIVALSVVSIVTQWYGVWKLTRLEPASDSWFIADRRVIARLGATVMACLVLVGVLSRGMRLGTTIGEQILIMLTLASLSLPPLGSVGFWLHVRRLESRLKSPFAPVLATILMVLMPAWTAAGMVLQRHDPVSRLEGAPSIVVGAPGIVIQWIQWLREHPRITDPTQLIAPSVPILGTAVLIHLSVRLWMVKHTTFMADSDEKTATSSGSSPR